MKVYLGKYPESPRPVRFFDRYMMKKYNFEWPRDEEYSYYEKFLCATEKAANAVFAKTFGNFLHNRKRVEKVHIHDYDIWSADHTMALVILPILKKLRDSKHGSPFVDDEDAPDDISSKKAPPTKAEYEWDVHNTLRWEYVLDEMIYAFACTVDDDWENQFYSGQHDITWEKTEDGKYYRAKRGPEDTFKVDREAMNKAWERRKNGLRLFGKYYHSLWD